jgi:protein-tyrosine-phosphatase
MDMQQQSPIGGYVALEARRLAPEPYAPAGRPEAAIILFPWRGGAGEPQPRPRSKLLFVCRTHSVLSPMAERLARAAFAPLDISFHSAGLSPRPLDRRVIGVMSEIGLDIDDVASTSVRELDLTSFQVVVSLGIHKLGLSRDQVAVTWAFSDFERVAADQVAVRRLRAVRDALSVRIQALGAALVADHRA